MATSTTKRSTTARKTTTTRAATTKTATAKATPRTATPAKPPVPKVVQMSEPQVSAPEMKKKELIDTVVERSGIKKKDAKPVVEAMLAVLGEAIGDGRKLNLQPLGKLRINRSEEKSNGRVIVCKLRQSKPTETPPRDALATPSEKPAKDPLAKPDDEM